jgi:hypothetical protein
MNEGKGGGVGRRIFYSVNNVKCPEYANVKPRNTAVGNNSAEQTTNNQHEPPQPLPTGRLDLQATVDV